MLNLSHTEKTNTFIDGLLACFDAMQNKINETHRSAMLEVVDYLKEERVRLLCWRDSLSQSIRAKEVASLAALYQERVASMLTDLTTDQVVRSYENRLQHALRIFFCIALHDALACHEKDVHAQSVQYYLEQLK